MVSRECIASWKVTHTHVRQHRGGDCNAVLVGAAHRRIARKAELRRGGVASHRDEACSDNASLDGGERDLEDSGEAHVHEDWIDLWVSLNDEDQSWIVAHDAAWQESRAGKLLLLFVLGRRV